MATTKPIYQVISPEIPRNMAEAAEIYGLTEPEIDRMKSADKDDPIRSYPERLDIQVDIIRNPETDEEIQAREKFEARYGAIYRGMGMAACDYEIKART